jgi:hypothetical protein
MMDIKSTNKDEAATPYLPSLAKATAAIVAMGGLALHLMGHTAHSTYLRQMNIGSEAFPKSTDWLVINGFYTLADRFLALLNALTKYWLVTVGVIVATSLYVYFYKLISKLPSKKSQPQVSRLPRWLSELVDSTALVTLSYGFGGMAILIIMFVLLVPAALGETAGKNLAARDMAEFGKFCVPEGNCLEVIRDGKIFVAGYLVATSPSHVAVYDPSLGKVRVIELDGVELRATPRSVTEKK